MIRVQAPSRLHFGLFSIPGEDRRLGNWPDLDGSLTIPARHFGGVGLMIDRPGIELTVMPAETWTAAGPSADRALGYAQRFCKALHVQQAFEISVHRCAPEHVGLGTGTQLGLAVARGIATATGQPRLTTTDLAWAVGRGRRSAIGIHGFAQGGLLVEGGKPAANEVEPFELSPLLCLAPFPAAWRIVLILPAGIRGEHGNREVQAFDQLARSARDPRQTDAMCRLALLGMLPAIAGNDLEAFGEALYDFNRRAGEWFRPWQGGTYSHPRVAELVAALRRAGVKGCGQSSWGPAVFAVVASDEHAVEVEQRLIEEGAASAEEITVARASRGAVCS